MKVKVIPISDHATTDISRTLANANDLNKSNTVVDANVFKHTAAKEKGIVYYDEYTKGAKIVLPIPVLNPFLFNGSSTAWASVLQMKSSDVSALAEGKAFIIEDPETDEGYRVCKVSSNSKDSKLESEPYAKSGCYLGGNAFKFLLKNAYEDIELIIADVIYKASVDILKVFALEGYPVLKRGADALRDRCIEVVKRTGSPNEPDYDNDPKYMHIWDTYYICARQGVNGVNNDDIDDAIQGFRQNEMAMHRFYCSVMHITGTSDTFYAGVTERLKHLPYLVAFRNNPKNFEDQIMHSVYVLPIGYRPGMDGHRNSSMTNKYNQLFSYTVALTYSIRNNNSTVSEVRGRYGDVVRSVYSIQKKKDKYDNQEYKAIAESLKH